MDDAVAAESTDGEMVFAVETLVAWVSGSAAARFAATRLAAGAAVVFVAAVVFTAVLVAALTAGLAAEAAVFAAVFLAGGDFAAALFDAGSVTLLPTAFFSLVAFTIVNQPPLTPLNH